MPKLVSDPTEGTSALILAGGDGQRMGGVDKAFLECNGLTLLERAVNQASRFAVQILVGLPQRQVERGRSLIGSDADIYAGGATRQGTFEILLEKARCDLVLVHDVARPLGTDHLFSRVISEARMHGAAAPCVSVGGRDSLALTERGYLGAPVDRARLVAIQTPYVFSKEILVSAVELARKNRVTETSVTTLVAAVGKPVRLVEGEETNLKITYPEDWDAVKTSLT